MKNRSLISLLFPILIFTMSGVSVVHGDETYLISPVVSYATVRFNNENWHTLPHPEVAEFTVRTDGSAYGLTVTGVSFIQYNVPNDYGIRVQRFEMEDHYHYVVDGEIAYTIEELSIKLAQAFEATMVTG